MKNAKPYLLLDVDGPVNPYALVTKKGYLPPKLRRGEEPYVYAKHMLRTKNWTDPQDLPVLLSRQMGADLDRLRHWFELVWATTWEDEANSILVPLLGLSEPLPVINWDVRHQSFSSRARTGSWKTPLILDWLAAREPRPWVFIDDDLTRSDRAFTGRHYANLGKGAAPRWKMLDIHPTHGLRRSDMSLLVQWAESAG